MADRTTDYWWDDEELLLGALDKALYPAENVPDDFIAAATACYTWHDVDAELAVLAYDSAADPVVQVTRAESPLLRTFTFEATDVTFELEATPDGLAGQLVPTGAGQLELQLRDGSTTAVPTGANGYFRIRPAPGTSFRLRCHRDDGRVVATGLIVL